ncbi:Signal transduction histidine kinase [Marinobacter daqiaonensis]|uniref:histidine kinase n=1 Tax=Marinobacter daqiaonensis TaxID=650891 RepID=A0A1I6GPF5_9GAMM|nr:ATP-binding protein [Marinobacter daqiaonensis]SFR44103.1 Signal transduction histidine kinase [Marinobacter daqiaonensis]
MKYSHAKRSLNRQLILLGALPAVLMFAGLMLFFTTARLSDAREDLFDSTQTLADNLAPALEYAVVSGNRSVVSQVLEQSMGRSNLEWIRVTDVMGKEMGFVGGPDYPRWPGQALESEEVERFSSEILQYPLDLAANDGTEWFETDYRLTGGALRVGTVEVAVSEQLLTERRSDILLTSGVVGISLLVFTLLLVNRMLAPVVEPIRALAAHLLDMTRREYREVEPTHARVAEIAELETNLNELARHLHQLKESRDQTLSLSESAREKAETASAAKSEFLAVMSHELRTPLNGVLAMVDLVAEEPLTPRQTDYLHTARKSTEDLLILIDDILDFSRLDQGKLLLESGHFNPAELAENCIASFRHTAEQAGLPLSLKLTGHWPDRPLLIGDAVRYRQVLACLLDNAIKFSDDGAITVVMDWHQESDDCVFLGCEVQDNGRGIPLEQVAQVFNSFEQLDGSLSREAGGTGIGLSLVQKLVELMGGHVRVATDIGEGSSFGFEVPFDVVSEQSPEQPEPLALTENAAGSRSGPNADGRRPPRALVVEDNPVNQRVARTLLERLGFDAEAVDNGREALQQVTSSAHQYTVILMDCHMPVMDGFEATEAIRDWERRQNVRQTPIIALTADALPHTESHCHKAGMNDYLAKPVRKHQLRTVLSRWVPL